MANIGSSLYIMYDHLLVEREGTSLNLELKTRDFCLVFVSFENTSSKIEGKTLLKGARRGVCLFFKVFNYKIGLAC